MEEGTEQQLVCLQDPRMPMSHGGDVLNFEGKPIGQRVHLRITPDVFGRVEFGFAGRKKGWR